MSISGHSLKFYEIISNEFINVEYIVTIKVSNDYVEIVDINNKTRTVKTEDLTTHFTNFISMFGA